MGIHLLMQAEVARVRTNVIAVIALVGLVGALVDELVHVQVIKAARGEHALVAFEYVVLVFQLVPGQVLVVRAHVWTLFALERVVGHVRRLVQLELPQHRGVKPATRALEYLLSLPMDRRVFD